MNLGAVARLGSQILFAMPQDHPRLEGNVSPGSTQVNNTHVGAKSGILFMELHIPCLFLAYPNVFPMYVHMCIDKYMDDDGIHTKSETL